jgi:hypothetical protein
VLNVRFLGKIKQKADSAGIQINGHPVGDWNLFHCQWSFRTALISVLKFVYLFIRLVINWNFSSFYTYCRHPLVWPSTFNYVKHKNWNISPNTEISWLPHSPRINDCICLIEFVLRCIYIEDGNRFMFSPEINKRWKPEVDIKTAFYSLILFCKYIVHVF